MVSLLKLFDPKLKHKVLMLSSHTAQSGLPALLYDDSFFTLCFTLSSVKLRFTLPMLCVFSVVKHKAKLYFILGVPVKNKVN